MNKSTVIIANTHQPRSIRKATFDLTENLELAKASWKDAKTSLG